MLHYRLIWEVRDPFDTPQPIAVGEGPPRTVHNLFQGVGGTEPAIPVPLKAFRQCVLDDRQEALELGDLLERSPPVVPGSVEIEGPFTGRCGGNVPMGQPPGDRQLHLQPGEQGGLDFVYAWSFEGGRGEGVSVIDVECGWLLDHPRLIARPRELVSAGTTAAGEDHGTAVLGLLWAEPSAEVEGMVTGADLLVAQTADGDPRFNVFNVLAQSALLAQPPAVILVERELSKVRMEDGRQFMRLPVESWRAGRTAVRLARERGIHVVMSAGNGNTHLVHGKPDGKANEDHLPLPPRGDSGAIVVGSRDSLTLPPHRLASTTGERVNVSAQGHRVTTLRVANPGESDFTWGFSGTSSAAAIVAGAVASLCGILEANGLSDRYGPRELRQLLVDTGRHPLDGMGVQPDLRWALEELDRKCGVLRPTSVTAGLIGSHTSLRC